jgi:hypothetical protein
LPLERRPTQAALPFPREQGGGHIVRVTSMGGVTAFPDARLYHASKWALEGLTLRVFFGIAPLDIEREDYAKRIATWERWNDLSRRAHGRR